MGFTGITSRARLPRARRCLPLRGKVRAAPRGLNVSGLLSFRRRVPSCRKGKKTESPCDAALPCGQGTLPGCVFDAVCPAGKGAADGRAGSWRIAGKNRISVRFAHQETFPARRGTGPPRVSPQRGRKYTPSRKRGASLSRHSSSINRARQTRPFTNRVSFLPHFAANIRRAPKPSFPRLFQPFCARKRPSLRPSRRLIPRHPAGRTAGSARTRSRVQTLENPFGGSRPHLPVSRPPTAAGGRPLLVGRPPCMRSAAGTETKRSTQAPCSWGLGA